MTCVSYSTAQSEPHMMNLQNLTSMRLLNYIKPTAAENSNTDEGASHSDSETGEDSSSASAEHHSDSEAETESAAESGSASDTMRPICFRMAFFLQTFRHPSYSCCSGFSPPIQFFWMSTGVYLSSEICLVGPLFSRYVKDRVFRT